MKNYLLGIDIGSGGCKVTLLNLADKNTITRSAEYPTYYPDTGWAEQDPECWVSGTGKLIGQIFREGRVKPSDVHAACISGVTHSPVLLDSKGGVIRRTIHLTDARSTKQAEYLRKKAGEYILSTCLNPVNVMWTAAMLLWVKECEPENWRKISKVFFPKDYVRFRLTGSEVTDHVDAEGTLLFDVIKKEWDEKLLALVGLSKKQLPETVSPMEVVGSVTEQGASWSGLKQGTPVVAGTTDTLLEVFAAGSHQPGDCTVKLATFGRICVITDAPVHDEKLITYSYIISGLWYPGTGTKSFASSLRWFRDVFCRDVGTHEVAYTLIEKEAAGVNAGSDGLLFHPYLQGEGSPYNDPFLRGGFLGLTLHHRRGHLIRAILEGTAFSLRDSIDFIKKKGIDIKQPLRFIGGGTKSGLWLQILADVLGMDGVIPRATDPSVGAALLAGAGTGVFAGIEEAQDFCAGTVKEVVHNPESTAVYSKLFSLYKKAHDELADTYHALSAFASG